MQRFDPFGDLPRGTTLIEASAGTGKTYTITTLVARLVVEFDLRIAHILLVTFTEAATAELRDRVRARFRELQQQLSKTDSSDPLAELWKQRLGSTVALQRIERCLIEFDDARISTIHGFCRRILQEHAFETGTPFDMQFDRSEQLTLREIAADFWSQRLHYATEHELDAWKKLDLNRFETLAHIAARDPDLRILPERSEDADRNESAFILREFIEFYKKELIKRRVTTRRISPNDLITGLDQALAGEHSHRLVQAIREHTFATLIDEFQDTDPAQYRIFHRLFGLQLLEGDHPWLFLIGDPKQAIYGFRGADLHTYLKAVNDTGERVYTLSTNYRSDTRLVHGFSKLFSRRHPFGDPGIQYVQVDAAHEDRLVTPKGYSPLQLLLVTGPDAQPLHYGDAEPTVIEATTSVLTRLLQRGAMIQGRPLLPADIAILVRNNAQLSKVQRSLSAHNIPSVVRNAGSVFETDEASELVDLLLALADPRRRRHLRTALTTSLFNRTAADLVSMNESDWDSITEQFEGWADHTRQRGIFSALHELFSATKAQQRLLAGIDGERRMTNFFHLTELLHQASREHQLGLPGLVEWLLLRRERGSEEIDSAKIRLETDSDAVQILTAHQSKGLQFPVVFASFLWMSEWLNLDCIFHDPHTGQRSFDVRNELSQLDPDHLAKARREAREELLRLAYVAVTRAEHLCIVAEPWLVRGFERSPLAYLLHPPLEHSDENWEETERHLSQLDLARIREDLSQWAKTSEGHIGFIESVPTPLRWIRPLASNPPQLLRRDCSHTIESHGKISSFSGLTQQGSDEIYDDEGMPAVLLPELSTEKIPWADFPKGPESGTFLHSILECTDFTSPPSLQQAIQATLPRFNLPEQPWLEQLPLLLGQTLATPLGIGSFHLSQLPKNQRLDELEFLLPASKLSPAALADVFRRYGHASWRESYADQIESLPFPILNGYLKGFIDLIFLYDAHWYVVDYKSNHLGELASDYEPSRLLAAMVEHHYILQYHLYTVALDRMLQWRQPGYQYDSHFGGVKYLFLRGMSPDFPLDNGVFSDRPSYELLTALAQFFVPTEHAS